MSETVTRIRNGRIPEGFAEPGCRICGRIAGIDLSWAWKVDEDSALDFPGRLGHIIAAPAKHPQVVTHEAVAAWNRWLAGHASEVAAGRGITPFDLILSEDEGHPYAEIVPRLAI